MPQFISDDELASGKIYLVCYELRNPTPGAYSKFFAVLRSLQAREVVPKVHLVRATFTAGEILSRLTGHDFIETFDKVAVFELGFGMALSPSVDPKATFRE